MRGLRGHPHREFASCFIVACQRAARFHRGGNEALVNYLLFNGDFSTAKCSIGCVLVAAIPRHADVVRRVLVQLGCARLGGFFGINHHWQRLVINLDQVECVARNIAIFGHNHGNAIARVQGLARRQGARSIRVVLHAPGLPRTRQRVDVHHVVAREDGNHTRQRLRFGGIDAIDFRVGIGAAQNRRMAHTLQLNIVEEVAFTSYELRVFAPL